MIKCKICRAPAERFAAIDFNRSCPVPGISLEPAGVEVLYCRCSDCGLIFTEALDDWTPEDFAEAIYNASYVAVDPEFVEIRPANMARIVTRDFGHTRTHLRVLDYGAGNGRFAENLRAQGWVDVVSYDPFHPEHARRPSGHFDLVTCFETIEHSPRPRQTFAEIADHLAEDGAIFFTTLVQPPNIIAIDADWWYIGPRNGHVTLFSSKALARLWEAHGLNCYSLSDNFHLAARQVPVWAAHIAERATLNSA